MNLVEKHIINRSNPLYKILDDLSFKSKNLYNYGLYLIRQQYLINKTFLNYYTLDKMLNSSNQVDYVALPSNTSQQVLRLLQKNFIGFFNSIKKNIKGVKLPKYKHKINGRNIISFTNVQCRIKTDGYIHFNKQSGIPPLKTKIIGRLISVRIVPITGAYKIEIVYEKQESNLNLDKSKHIAIDLGLNNLMTITSDTGLMPQIINGRPLKSINQYFNKKLAYLKSKLSYGINSSKRIDKLYLNRFNKIDNYLHHSSKYIINLCIKENIGTIIIGKNDGWKQNINLGKKVNQSFVQVPFNTLISQIIYKAKLVGIDVKVINEAYTSRCSALDMEPLCKHDNYIGSRIFRGLFKWSGGLLNADVNGSLNILRKEIGDALFTKDVANRGTRLCAVKKINTICLS